MPWTVTDDADRFLAAALPLLTADRVSSAPLLTEAAFLAVRPDPRARFGLWRNGSGPTVAAFVQAPDHPVLLSRRPGGDGDAVRGAVPDPTTVDQGGAARVAVEADRALLVRWYGTLLAGLADDATDLAFLVDVPLAAGGAVLWERDGAPCGVAVRTPCAGGVTKVTAAWSPTDERYARAAFVAACAAARAVATTVVAVARPEPAADAWHASVGFVPGAERVLLAAQAGRRAST